MITTENYLKQIELCKTQLEAERISNQIYVLANTTSEGFFKAPFTLTWEIFYKLLELENVYHLSNFASAYVAVVLIKPKLSANWLKRANVKKWSDFDDYCNEIYYHIAQNVIPKWDKEINDNFLAYLTPELLTILNETAKPEVSKYIQKKYGRTVNSIDAISQELGHEFDVEDKHFSTEKTVLKTIEKEEKSYYQALIFQKKHNENKDTISKEDIKRALIVSQIFGGLANDLNLSKRVFLALEEKEKLAMKKKEKTYHYDDFVLE